MRISLFLTSRRTPRSAFRKNLGASSCKQAMRTMQAWSSAVRRFKSGGRGWVPPIPICTSLRPMATRRITSAWFMPRSPQAGPLLMRQTLTQSAALYGVTAGYAPEFPATRMPRAKTMFGMSRDYLDALAASMDATCHVEDGQLQVVPNHGYLPGEA